jgi:hypothetical protein
MLCKWGHTDRWTVHFYYATLQNKNRLNWLVLPEKGLDTGKYKKNEQRAKPSKLGKAELWFYALHFYSMRSIYLYSFVMISLIVLELCPE